MYPTLRLSRWVFLVVIVSGPPVWAWSARLVPVQDGPVQSAPAPVGSPDGAQAPTLPVLLSRAGAYAARYGRDFAKVVAEEHYLQLSTGRQTLSGAGRGTIAGNTGPQRRELVSDFLLVKLAADQGWVPFRDVFEVDGTAVRERQDRLIKLVLQPSPVAMDQAKAILEESARFNIGDVERTINMPLLALTFLEPGQQVRFRFRLGKLDPAAGPGVRVVSYREEATPTVVHSPDGRNLFASGRLWIGEADGRIVRTELVLQDSGLRASITTAYRPDSRFGLDVPVEMIEDYTLWRSKAKVSGKATYGRFRSFGVSSTATVPLPEVNGGAGATDVEVDQSGRPQPPSGGGAQ